MYFKCTCGVGSSIKLKYDWLMCSGLTFRENTKCFLNTLQNHFDDPYSQNTGTYSHTPVPPVDLVVTKISCLSSAATLLRHNIRSIVHLLQSFPRYST